MAEGVVFDLGYQKHEGERLGRAGAVRALVRDGLRRVIGLRRRARRKVLPIALLAIAVLPALFYVAFGIVAGELAQDAELFGHARYFDLTGGIAIVFIALAAAELLVPDRVHGTLSVYASRPLTTPDYVLGRAAALSILVFGFLWLPHLLLFLGRAWVSSSGFGHYATANWSTLVETAGASAVYLLAFGPIAFLIGTLASRPAVAAGAFVGTVTISGPATAALVDSGSFKPLGLLALQHNPGYVKDWLMDADTHRWIPERAGFDPVASLAVIVVLAVACSALTLFRFRRLQ